MQAVSQRIVQSANLTAAQVVEVVAETMVLPERVEPVDVIAEVGAVAVVVLLRMLLVRAGMEPRASRLSRLTRRG